MTKKPRVVAAISNTFSQNIASQREEAVVFEELRALCHAPGYIHAIARVCVCDNMIAHEGQVKPDDMLKLYKPEKLLRNEVNACLGLWLQGPRDFEPIDKATAESYIGNPPIFRAR